MAPVILLTCVAVVLNAIGTLLIADLALSNRHEMTVTAWLRSHPWPCGILVSAVWITSAVLTWHLYRPQ